MADNVIKTAIETGKAEKDASRLRASILRTAQAADNMSKSMLKSFESAEKNASDATAAVEKQKEVVARLTAELEKLKTQTEPASEMYVHISKEAEKASKKVEALTEKRDKLLETGKGNTAAFKNTEAELAYYQNMFDQYAKRQAEMLKSGTAYAPVDTAKQEASLAKEQATLDSLIAKEEAARQRAAEAAAEQEKLAQAGLMTKFKDSCAQVANTLKNGVLSGLRAVRKEGSKMNHQPDFKKLLRNILKYGLGVRSLFVLYRKLRAAVTEGFKNLAQADSGINKTISSLKSGLSQLKNGTAAAFAPLLTSVAPALQQIVNWANAAVTALAELFAMLGGQTTFKKATAVQEDYAKSLGGSAKAAKEILSPLDDINKLSKDSGGGGGAGAAGMFVDAEVTDRFQSVKDLMAKIFQPFKDAWANEGQTTIEKAKAAFESLKSVASSVASSVLEVWTNGTGQKQIETVLRIAQALLGTVSNIADKFKEAWDNNAVGTGIIQAIANIVQTVLDFAQKIADATERWSDGLDFYPLLESIKKVLEEIQPVIEDIGDWVSTIYEEIILPFVEWLVEKAIPWIIDKAGDLFTFLDEHSWIIELVGALLIGAFAAGHLVPMIMAIATAVSVLSELIGMMGLVGTVKLLISYLGACISPFGLVTAAIAAVIAIGVLLISHWDEVKAKSVEIANKVKDAFSNMGDRIGSIFEGIKNKIKSAINGIIGFINRGLNVSVPSWVPYIGGNSWSPNIPYLAKGAVIPPNAPFAAVLGDQRSGNNIETPESLLRKIVREESGSRGGGYRFTATINRRTLFDEMITEAKLRQSANGDNPFELA